VRRARGLLSRWHCTYRPCSHVAQEAIRATDLGPDGLINFFKHHKCNKFCRKECTRPRKQTTAVEIVPKAGTSMMNSKGQMLVPTANSRLPITRPVATKVKTPHTPAPPKIDGPAEVKHDPWGVGGSGTHQRNGQSGYTDPRTGICHASRKSQGASGTGCDCAATGGMTTISVTYIIERCACVQPLQRAADDRCSIINMETWYPYFHNVYISR
jgi:hypothetical protein